MSQSGPNDADDSSNDPAAMGMFLSNLMGSLSGMSDQWSGAEQLAASVATAGVPEPNVDPLERLRVEQLCRVAEMHIGRVTGLELTRGGRPVEIVPLTRAQWTREALGAYRPLFEQLSGSLSRLMRSQLDGIDAQDIADLDEVVPGLNLPGGIDAAAMLAGLSQLMGPMMLTMMAGSTVGQLATRSFGSYDLPLPRSGSDAQRLSVIAPNIDGFAADWSLPPDDVRLWVCLSELAHHAVLNVPHVRDRLTNLLGAHAAAFRADPDSLSDRLGDLDLDNPNDVDQLQRLLSNPELALGAMRSDEQSALLPELNAVVSVIEGYVDDVVDQVASTLLTSHSQVGEALRRRRVEADQATRFVEKLFGLELTTENVDAGRRFVDATNDLGGSDATGELWRRADGLPTPIEVAQPALWLARMGVEVALPELDESWDVPDYPDLDDGANPG